MKCRYDNLVIDFNFPFELINKLSKIISPYQNASHYFVCDYFDCSSYHSDSMLKELIKRGVLEPITENDDLFVLLNSRFNIPTEGNFANRSAIEMCKQFPPYKDYNEKTTLYFSMYLISLTKAMIRSQVNKFISTNTDYIVSMSKQQGDQHENKMDAFCEFVTKTILVNYKIESDIVLKHSCSAKWCDEITKHNIQDYLQHKKVINPFNNGFVSFVISELGLNDSNFVISSIQESLPITTISNILFFRY